MKQSLEYAFLRNNLTLNNLPRLRMMQFARAKENFLTGLELGFSERESAKMAFEDFATAAERMVEAELILNLGWLCMQDGREIYQAMLVCDKFGKTI
ncbi:MAG: hypothetical protein LBD94_03270 [Rickettsiales bacterium]|jgi:hypothetical protein|nr:hypothetical protein [Rickettsiales bacterium]